MTTVDVLVVGGGPVGLAVATSLKLWGLTPLVVERRTSETPTSRAMGVHKRTLEILGTMGVLDTGHATPESPSAPASSAIGGVFYRGDRVWLKWPRASVEAKRSRSPFSGRWWPQSQLEQALLDRYQALGGNLELGVEITGIETSETAVRVSSADSAYTAKWVIACDGGRSTIRKLMGVPFPGRTHDQDLILVDVDLEWDGAPPAWASEEGHAIHAWMAREGPFHIWRLPRRTEWRLMGFEPTPSDAPLTQPSVEMMDDWLRDRAGVTNARVKAVHWMTSWKMSERMLTSFRHGRVFFAGDAAHIHSPLGGQGLNGGIQDAFNLAWKLAAVEQQGAREALLDTYDEERLPVARGVLRFTRALARLVGGTYPAGRLLRDQVALRLLRLSRVRGRLMLKISQVKLNYRGSSLSRSVGRFPRGAVKAGDRMPEATVARHPSGETSTLFGEVAGTAWNALIFAGSASADIVKLSEAAAKVGRALPSRGNTYLILRAPPVQELDVDAVILVDPGDAHETFGVERECVYVLRPDGYVGLRCASLDAATVRDYFGATLGQGTASQVSPPAAATTR